MTDMCQRRFHYDLAFESYLRAQAIPYVAVDEAKRALHRPAGSRPSEPPGAIKSFDFVVYSGSGHNLLVDVKGRRHRSAGRGMQNWVTHDDVTSLRRWQGLFGQGFEAVFAFLYWCQQPPDGALFQDVFEAGDRWYCLLAVRLEDYAAHMRPRSARWDTVSLPAATFRDLAVPLKQLL